MKRLRKVVVILLGVLLMGGYMAPMQAQMSSSAFAQQIRSSRYKTYYNQRFGFSFSYPACFRRMGAANNGDGQAFICGDAVLRIYASHNVMNWSISRAFRENAFYPTYKVVKGNYYIASGNLQSGEIYYEKCVLKNGVFYTVHLAYPQSYQKSVNGLIKRIAAFRP